MRFKDTWKFAGTNKSGMRWYKCVDQNKSFKDQEKNLFKSNEVLLVDSQKLPDKGGVDFYGVIPLKDIKTSCINLWRKLDETKI
jgi:hypothetical protein